MTDDFSKGGIGIKSFNFPFVDKYLRISIINCLAAEVLPINFEDSDDFHLIINSIPFQCNPNIISYFSNSKKLERTKLEIEIEESKNYDESKLKEILPFFEGKKICINRDNYLTFEKVAKSVHIPAFLKISFIFKRFYSIYNRLESISKIQYNIMEINEKTVDNVINEILTFDFFSNDELNVDKDLLLFHILMEGVQKRPQSIQFYIQIIKKLKEKSFNNVFKVFQERFLKKINSFSDFHFLYMLMINGIFTEEEVVAEIKSTTNFAAKIWFVPFLKNEEESKSLIQNIDDCINSIYDPEIRKERKKFFKMISENNWELHRKYAVEGQNHNEVCRIIRNDDVEQLEQFLISTHPSNAIKSSSKTNLIGKEENNKFDDDNENMTKDIVLDVNQSVPWSYFEMSSFLINRPTLIQYAAFFRSTKCFEFLTRHDASYTKTDGNNVRLIDFAVGGGDMSIIEKCIANPNVDCLTALGSSILFFKYDLVDYILRRVVPSLEWSNFSKEDAFIQSCESFNFCETLKFFDWATGEACTRAVIGNNELLVDMLCLFDYEDKIDMLKCSPQSMNLNLINKLYVLLENENRILPSNSVFNLASMTSIENIADSIINRGTSHKMYSMYKSNPQRGYNFENLDLDDDYSYSDFEIEDNDNGILSNKTTSENTNENNNSNNNDNENNNINDNNDNRNKNENKNDSDDGNDKQNKIKSKTINKVRKNMSKQMNNCIYETTLQAICLDIPEVLEYLEVTKENVIDYSEEISENQDLFTFCITCGSIKCLKYITSRPGFIASDWNRREGYAVLRVAILNSHSEIVKFLLEEFKKELNVDATEQEGGSGFTAATWTNQIQIARLLYENGGVDVNMVGKRGETPLTGAIKQRMTKMLRFLVDIPEIDTYKPSRVDGKTPMMIIIDNEDCKSYRIFVQKDNRAKFDANDKRSCGGVTTQEYALRSESKMMIELVMSTPEVDLSVQPEGENGKTVKQLMEEFLEK